MVESTQTIQAAEAIRSLYAAGLGEREIHELVNAVATEAKTTQPHSANGDGLKVYEVLPEGLIDAPSAARKYKRATGTLRNWVGNGRLEVVGRYLAPAPGGGYLVFREADVAELDEQTPRRKR